MNRKVSSPPLFPLVPWMSSSCVASAVSAASNVKIESPRASAERERDVRAEKSQVRKAADKQGFPGQSPPALP